MTSTRNFRVGFIPMESNPSRDGLPHVVTCTERDERILLNETKETLGNCMTVRLFESRPFEDSHSVVVVKRAFLVVLAVCCLVAAMSGQRAYFQIRDFDIHSSERVLRAGSRVQTSIVTSGRAFADVRLEMIQGARSETLAVQQVAKNDYALIDPRRQRASLTVTLTPGLLARFRTGSARLRATATGRAQWLRVPPPEVRELGVEIEHGRADSLSP